MSEENPTTSLRQLPPGQLENIRKRFESVGESPQASENGVKLRPKPHAQSSPVHQRPTTTVLDSPVRTIMNKEKLRPKSTAVLPSSSPRVATVLNKFESVGNEENLNVTPKPKTRDISPHKFTVKPTISKKPSFTKADDQEKPPILKKPSFSASDEKKKPVVVNRCSTGDVSENDKHSKPVSVVQRRTQMFESVDNTGEPNTLSNVKSVPPPRPAPPVKPSSRPPSVSTDDQEVPFYAEVIKKKKNSDSMEEEDGRRQYCEAWDTKPVSKLISSPAKQPAVPPPPKKPPRTGAHDEYMQMKKQGVAFHLYDDVPDEQLSPVYRKIVKSSVTDSNNKPDIKMPRPSRPPPPRARPVTVSGLEKESSEMKSELPHKPLSSPSLKVYEEVNGGDFSISNIKHWDLPLPVPPSVTSIPSHGSTNLKRSLSMDSLMGNPVYCDPALTVKSRDDSEIYMDSEGYAMPTGTPTHRGLGNSASLDTDPSSGGICRPLSHAVMKQLKKLKPAIKPKRASARENWKKLQNVKMKINIAFAVVRQMKGEQHRTESTSDNSDVDSLVDESEIKKRISHCGTVRKNTSKSIRKAWQIQTQTYNQMFDFCLIVGLEPINDSQTSYKPKIIYKFPDLVESNATIPEFCFPDAEEFDAKSASAAAPSESYSFVLTNVEGERVYGYCRRMVPFSSKSGLPEVICIVSPVDAFSMYNELLDAAENCRHKSLDLARELLSAAFGRPLPEPGKLVQVRTLDENWDTGTILLSRPEDFRVDNVNREYLLSKLGVDKLLKLFSCMLLERSVLFCAKNLSILSQTIHALVALLYPFRWQHTYIPVLPESMLDVTCSPTPYIIGILSSHLPYVLKLPISEIVIFDLNKKQMLKCQGDEGIILPKDIHKALKTALNMCKVDADVKMASNLMMSEAFLRMFVEAVGHYAEHIITQQDGEKVFQKEHFIQDSPTESMAQFLQWFCETQMFEVFITEQTERNKSAKKKSKTIELFNQRIVEARTENVDKKGKKNKGLLKMLMT
ncbi:DENN domain-containing protein 2B-like isoform X2 [Saccostrea echinata]|uniref:DENN domain-containing protein 2B-like isoform X2 n=1 Tax=Saccostrea echinata TaxID=191078 RepID=UPI002A802CD9|nr:DENN domain-containing protein 2B-like isoform X2 [Saccostrea echinata]